MVYPYVFVQPLYVPSDFLHFSFGDRFREGGQGIPPGADAQVFGQIRQAMLDKGLPFLNRVATPVTFATWLEERLNPRVPQYREALGYSWALVGDVERAVDVLAPLLDPGALNRASGPHWQMAERTERALSLLRRDPTAFQQQLREWRDTTARVLGVA